MTCLFIFYACLVALPYCIDLSEGGKQTTWLVNSTANSSVSHSHHYDRRFDNLSEALAALSILSIEMKVTNLTLLIGKGKHLIDGKFTIVGCDHLAIASEETNKTSVFLDVAADHSTSISNVQFINNTNIALSYLTARSVVSGGRSTFTFVQCDHVIVKECSFINSLSSSSSLLFFNSESVYILCCTFLFTVTLQENRNTTASLSYVHNVTYRDDTRRKALNVSNCRFASNETRPFIGYGSIGRDHEVPIQESAVLAIGLWSRNLDIVLNNCQVTGLADAFAVPVLISMLTGSVNNTITLTHFHIFDNMCVTGCGIVSYFNGSAANTVSITDSSFVNNTAVIEGGAGMGYVSHCPFDAFRQRNSVHYQRCLFADNVAGRAFGGGSAFISFSTQEFLGGNVMQLHESDLQANLKFTDCTFTNNSALRGTVFAKNSDVTFDGDWSVRFINCVHAVLL